MSEKEKKRNYQIDNIRAIAILLVVLGHSIIIYSSSWGIYKSNRECVLFDNLKGMINLIQMPLFFAVSGFLFAYSVYKKEFVGIIKDKVLRLLVPYLFFAVLWVVPIRLIVRYPGYRDKSLLYIIGKCIIYGSDNGHLWYLITLFWIFVIVGGFVKAFTKLTKACPSSDKNNTNKIQKLICGALLLFCAFIFVLGKAVNLRYFNSVSQYMIWFAIGILLQNNYQWITQQKRNVKSLLMIFSFVSILFCIWKKTGLMYSFLSVISTFSLIILIFMIVSNRRITILMYFASVSFGVYLFHSPLVYISYTYFPDIHPGLMLFINFVLFGCVSLILTQVCKKTKFKFIIGEYEKKEILK